MASPTEEHARELLADVLELKQEGASAFAAGEFARATEARAEGRFPNASIKLRNAPNKSVFCAQTP